jgi:hypothetical protein
MDSHECSQLISQHKSQKKKIQPNGTKTVFSTNGVRKTRHTHAKKNLEQTIPLSQNLTQMEREEQPEQGRHLGQ